MVSANNFYITSECLLILILFKRHKIQIPCHFLHISGKRPRYVICLLVNCVVPYTSVILLVLSIISYSYMDLYIV